MAFKKINNTNYYYELHGAGEQSLVLIAGYVADHTFFATIIEQLSKHFKVLVFDNQGIGQTEYDGAPLTAESMADDTMALVAALGLEKPHVAGFSMGGTIAQTIAVRHPDKIAKLGLIATTAKWRKAMLQTYGNALDMFKQGLDMKWQVQTLAPFVFGEKFLADVDNVEAFMEAIVNNPYPWKAADIERQYAMMEQFDGRDNLKQIKAETLIVCGHQDLNTLPRESVLMQQQIPNSTLVEIDCGHAMTAEVPDELASIMCEFFV